MIIIGLVAFAAYVIASFWYIQKLHARLRAHEEAWNQIEKLTDHNKDGDIIIHARHIGDDP